MSMPSGVAYFEFTSKLSSLFADGKRLGLTNEQLVKAAEGQLDMEKRLKEADDAAGRLT